MGRAATHPMPRTNREEAKARHLRVLELAQAEPGLTHDEMAERLGLSRAMVTYYMNRPHRLAIRRDALLLRKKSGRKRRRRNAFYVSMRAAAVRAVRQAFPHMSVQEISEALDFDVGMVKYYLLGEVKSELQTRPAWADLLLSACRELGTSRLMPAAVKFEQLARDLYSAARTDA